VIRATWRTARKPRRCECSALITPGERYIEHVMSPYHDTIGGETWQRCAECLPCATRNGRAELEPTS
jgi:hypothetical protein